MSESPDSGPTPSAAPRTALVLGGGGVTGIAWMLGLVHGLKKGGVDLGTAERVVGTSAGSVVGAQLTGGLDAAELYDGQLAPPDHETGAAFGLRETALMVVPMVLPGSGRARRRRVAAVSRRVRPTGDRSRVDVIAARIRVGAWPDRDVRVTAVDGHTGALEVFTRDSGVPLVEAVAASCAVPMVWPAVRIGDREFVDGGIRSTANADLARGAERVVVLAPLPRSFSKGGSIPAQLERIGSPTSTVVSPDEQALAAIGDNVLDPTKRALAARAGLRQSQDVLAQVGDVWR